MESVEGPYTSAGSTVYKGVADSCSAGRCVPENLHELLTYKEPRKWNSYQLNAASGIAAYGGLTGKAITSKLVVFSQINADKVLGWYWYN